MDLGQDAKGGIELEEGKMTWTFSTLLFAFTQYLCFLRLMESKEILLSTATFVEPTALWDCTFRSLPPQYLVLAHFLHMLSKIQFLRPILCVSYCWVRAAWFIFSIFVTITLNLLEQGATVYFHFNSNNFMDSVLFFCVISYSDDYLSCIFA